MSLIDYDIFTGETPSPTETKPLVEHPLKEPPSETKPLVERPLKEPLNDYLASPYLLIDEHLTLSGTVCANRKVWVNGVIEGTVHCPSIVVGESARITGCIMADDAVVNGHVHGDINGLRVRLRAITHDHRPVDRRQVHDIRQGECLRRVVLGK